MKKVCHINNSISNDCGDFETILRGVLLFIACPSSALYVHQNSAMNGAHKLFPGVRPIVIDTFFSEISELFRAFVLRVQTSPRKNRLVLIPESSFLEESETFVLQRSTSESYPVNTPWCLQAFENNQVTCLSRQFRVSPKKTGGDT